MLEKSQMVKNYILQVASQVNEQYHGLIDDEKLNRAIDMFVNLPEEYDTIVQKINQLLNQTIQNHLEELKQRFDPQLVEKNHEEIYRRLELLAEKLNEKGIDYQLAGSLCAYLKYGIESNRTHDDIDINLNEEDIEKFASVCKELGLQFYDHRLTTSRILKNGIPFGEHEVGATLAGSDFHIGAFCFERKADGTIINKGYYHDETGQIFSRNDILSPQLANEIFGREQVVFRGQKILITPPEYIYQLKNYTNNSKDQVDVSFMKNRIDSNKLARIEELSKSARTEYQKVLGSIRTPIRQDFNYHTHTYRSGHSEYMSDEEILITAKQAGFTTLGFSEHIPNPDLVLPDEDHRMLLSEVDDYLSSIDQLQKNHPDMHVLSGFEAEFDPMREAFLGEMRNKVDYMILGQHFVSDQMQMVSPQNNPNYPLIYANMVCHAMDSGIFDIVAHPDLFLQYRDSMKDAESKTLFAKNSILASQMICEKAKDMGIPIEINLSPALNHQILSDGHLAYPHPIFWQVAQKVEGLRVLKGIDAHDLGALKEVDKASSLISNIEQMVSDKLITDHYNPITARENNPKLQDAYRTGQSKALTFETNMIHYVVENSLSKIDDQHSLADCITIVNHSLDATKEQCLTGATRKNATIAREIPQIADTINMTPEAKKLKLSRKKKALEETNKTLINQHRAIENAENATRTIQQIGCETKQEMNVLMTKITQFNTTKKENQKKDLYSQLSQFQQSKKTARTQNLTRGHQYVKKNSNNKTSTTGYTNLIALWLISIYTFAISVGMGYLLYVMSNS